jgi:hypothetical protein
MADTAITYWHRAGKLSAAKSAVHEAIAQLREASVCWTGYPRLASANNWSSISMSP